nr:putative ribonuclease H-like domain-containing protein [Tanacetum cinerariifolium]
SDSDDEHVTIPSKEQEKPSFAFVNTVEHVKTPRFPVNAAKQNFSSQAASTSTARKVNTARPKVNEIRPRYNVYKSHSPIRRPFKRTTTPKPHFTQHKVNIVRDKSVSAVGGKWETAVKASAWNKAYLVDYQDFNGDPVAFGGSKGIKREYSNARTSQQNRVAERKNRTLIEAARTMLANLFLPNTFWAEPVSTVCYVLNMVLVTKPHNKTSYELLAAKNGDKNLNEDTDSKTNEEPLDQEDQAFLEELERLKRQEIEANDAAETLRKTFAQSTEDFLLQAGAARASSTNYVASTPVNDASTSLNTANTQTNQDDSA